MIEYEAFKYLHVGLISDIKRKSLPAIAKIVGLENEQGLLHSFNRITLESGGVREEKIRNNFKCVRRKGDGCHHR